MSIKLQQIDIKALHNKDMKSPRHFLFINLYHGFMSSCFCSITKADHPLWFFFFFKLILCHYHIQVRKLSYSQLIQSTPVKASGSQRANTISLLWLGGLLEEGRQRTSWRQARPCSWTRGWSALHPVRPCLEAGGWGLRFQDRGLPISNETRREDD